MSQAPPSIGDVAAMPARGRRPIRWAQLAEAVALAESRIAERCLDGSINGG